MKILLPSSHNLLATFVGVALLVLLNLSLGCGDSRATPSTPPTVTIQTPDEPTPTPTQFSEVSCVWNWAYQPLPEITAQIRQRFTEAGIAATDIAAIAFGENCINGETGQIVRFAAMQTDFEVTGEVGDFEDADTVGEKVRAIIQILEEFPPESTPGPAPGNLKITITSGARTGHLNVKVTQAYQSAKDIQSGAKLLQQLDYTEITPSQ